MPETLTLIPAYNIVLFAGTTVLRGYVDTRVQRERVGRPSFADKAVNTTTLSERVASVLPKTPFAIGRDSRPPQRLYSRYECALATHYG